MIPFNAQSSFDLLLHKLFDYAGMFPPAALTFERAVAESSELPSRLRRPWLLGSDMVLDAAHARKLGGMTREESGFTRPVRLCLLATEPLSTVSALMETLTQSASVGRLEMVIASLEVKVPRGGAHEAAASCDSAAKRHNTLLALEPDLSTPEWEESLQEVLAVAAAGRGRIALKCRCTGATGIGADRLARALVCACDAHIPFKVTGGFHHPVVEPAHHTYPMGFLNLVTAVVLRTVCASKASEDTVRKLLSNDSASVFSFENGVTAFGLSASHAEVRAARQKIQFSIGSCSLTEPDDDLLRLFPQGH